LVSGAPYRFDLPKETITMTATINSDKEGEDVGRNLLPKELYQRKERNGARRWLSMRGI